MEIKTEVKTFLVKMICDKCGEGEMIFNGFTKTSNPPWHVHKCNKCGNIEDYRTYYPKQVNE